MKKGKDNKTNGHGMDVVEIAPEQVMVPNHTGALQAEIELPPRGELDLLIRAEVKTQLLQALLQGLGEMLTDGRAYVVELSGVGIKLGDVRRGLRTMDQDIQVTLADVPSAQVGEHIWLKTLPGEFWEAPEGAVVAVSVPVFEKGTEVWYKEPRHFVRDRVGFRRIEYTSDAAPASDVAGNDGDAEERNEADAEVSHDAQ